MCPARSHWAKNLCEQPEPSPVSSQPTVPLAWSLLGTEGVGSTQRRWKFIWCLKKKGSLFKGYTKDPQDPVFSWQILTYKQILFHWLDISISSPCTSTPWIAIWWSHMNNEWGLTVQMLYVLRKGKHKTVIHSLLKSLGKPSLQSSMPISINHPHESVSHGITAISGCIWVWYWKSKF